jgi:UDP-GlcNAc:undecaprenyl-phosphate GlcNAc-1-phosphate transferase
MKALGVRVKFLTQVIAAAVAMNFGYVIHEIGLPWVGTLQLGLWSVPVTLLWVVGLTNAFNLIDGLDGLASGVALISSLTLMGIAMLNQNLELALLCAVLAGCLLGFLPYNFHPASIFLGDSGSLFLGFTLAVLSITTSHKSTVVVSLLLPMLAFGLPIMDTLLSMARRFLRAIHVWETAPSGMYRIFFIGGRTIFEADRDHIHHRLMRLGVTHSNAVIFLYAACAVMGAAALIIASYNNLNTGLILLAMGVAVAIAIRKLRYEELQLLRNGALVPLSKFPILGYESFQIPVDLIMVSFAYYAAYWLRFEGVFEEPAKSSFITTLPVVLLTKIVVFHLSGLYRIKWRRAGVPELLRGVRSMVLGAGAAAAVLMLLRINQCSKAVLIVDLYAMGSLLLGTRLSVRLVDYYAQSNPAHKRRVLIYGTGRTASLLIHELQFNQSHSMVPVGFIGDDYGKKKKLLYGYPIFGPSSVLPDVLHNNDIQELIIATTKLSPLRIEEITELARHHNVTLRRFRISIENLSQPSSELVTVSDPQNSVFSKLSS